MNPNNTDFLSEAKRLVMEIEMEGLHLRLLGSLAFRFHCPHYQHLFEQMHRDLTDIDFAGLRQERAAIREFFEAQGYTTNPNMLVVFEGSRFLFEHPQNNLHIDVFVDKLEFCHAIDFSKRLTFDSPTIPLPELLLEKMQIIEINAKDIKDTIILLLEHDIGGPGDQNVLDSDFICRVLSADWGFYYTVTRNLKKVRNFLNEFGALSEEEQKIIESRIDFLLNRIEEYPKSLGWKLRKMIGTRIRWYNEVDDIMKGTGI
jgi:hypothetical protein